MLTNRHRLSFRQTGMCSLCALWLAGCSLRGNIDVLESQLRQQEQAQEETTAQLAHARNELKVAQRDSEALRKQ